jgi:hypothetical protein
MPIKQSEFIEFFEEKKKGIYLCPVCASHGFLINVDGPTLPLEQQGNSLLSEMRLGPTGSHAFISLSCNNCGTTTFMNVQQINSWKALKKPGGD